MTILSIDTSTCECSAAICTEGQVLAVRETHNANHAACLPVMVEELLGEAQSQGIRPDAVALSEGPGSYTGLRIGAAMAKGLCYGLNIPLIPISTLQAMALQAQNDIRSTEDYLLCPMIDARRMEVYCAVYDQHLNTVLAPKAEIVTEHSFERLLQDNIVYFFGDGAAKCQQVINSSRMFILQTIVPSAVSVAHLAEKGQPMSIKEMAYFSPFYLKEYIPAPSHVKGLR